MNGWLLPIYKIEYNYGRTLGREGVAYVPAESLSAAREMVIRRFEESEYCPMTPKIIFAEETTYKASNEMSRGGSEKRIGSKFINCPEYWLVREFLETSAPKEIQEGFERLIFNGDVKLSQAAEIKCQKERGWRQSFYSRRPTRP